MKTSLCSATDVVDSAIGNCIAQRACRTQKWHLANLNPKPQPSHRLTQPTCKLPGKLSKRVASKHVDVQLKPILVARTFQEIITPWINHVGWQLPHKLSGSALTTLKRWWDKRAFVRRSHMELNIVRWHPKVNSRSYYSHVREQASACMYPVRPAVPSSLAKRVMWIWLTRALLAWPVVLLHANVLLTLMPCSKSVI